MNKVKYENLTLCDCDVLYNLCDINCICDGDNKEIIEEESNGK